MNLLEIFADPRHLELALSVAALPADSRVREERLAEVGIPASKRDEFLHSLRVFEHLRTEAGCGPCDDTTHCLDENTLAEFVDGVLPEPDRVRVERQLAYCGSCLSKAVTLAQLTHELTPAPRWPEVVLGMARRGIQIVSAPFEGFAEQALQAVPVLASEDTAPAARRWQVLHEGVTATFTMVVEDSGMACLRVHFDKDGAPLTEGQVGLRLDDALLESRPLHSAPEQTFSHLEPGHYLLELTPDAAAYGIVLEDHAAQA